MQGEYAHPFLFSIGNPPKSLADSETVKPVSVGAFFGKNSLPLQSGIRETFE